jgi:hypothetical protein
MEFNPASKDEWMRPMRCLLFLLLAFMVFAWGTGYKLSLYKSLREDGSSPAKLSTRSSDVAQSDLQNATADRGPIEVVSVATALPIPSAPPCASSLDRIDDGQPINPSPFHPPSALDLRPPPMSPFEFA